MHRTGHLGLAMCCWTVVASVALLPGRPALAVLGGVVCVWFATVPDVDLSLPGVRHRGPTHSLAFAAAFGAFAAFSTLELVAALRHPAVAPHVGAIWEPFLAALPDPARPHVAALTASRPVAAVVGLAAATAVCSHVLGDALTPMGVELLWPVTDANVSVGIVRAGNPVANYGALVAGAGALGHLLLVGERLASLSARVPALG